MQGLNINIFEDGQVIHVDDIRNGYSISAISENGFHTEHGAFGADMKVSLLNDGPFTIMLDSEDIIK